MTCYIENCSMRDAQLGLHSDLGANTMLIRIQDPATEFKPTKYIFPEVYQFEFLDAEDADNYPEEFKISDEQAQSIARLLQRAMNTSMNVLVHCHAGICRSGAVTEVGTMLGFTATEKLRIPNLRVKRKLMDALGWGYGVEDEQTSTQFHKDI